MGPNALIAVNSDPLGNHQWNNIRGFRRGRECTQPCEGGGGGVKVPTAQYLGTWDLGNSIYSIGFG